MLEASLLIAGISQRRGRLLFVNQKKQKDSVFRAVLISAPQAQRSKSFLRRFFQKSGCFLAPRGICGTVGVPAGAKELTLDIVDMMTHGKTFRGIVQREATPDIVFQTLIELYRQGQFPVNRLICYYPFPEINQTGKIIKAVLRF